MIRTLRFFAFSLAVAFAALPGAGDSAEFNDVRLEFDQVIHGRKTIAVHSDITLHGTAGNTYYLNMWVKAPSGSWHNVNSHNRLSSGITYFQAQQELPYNDSRFFDWVIDPYLSDFNLLPGKNKYKIILTVTDAYGNQLGQSNEYAFYGTGKGKKDGTTPKPTGGKKKKTGKGGRKVVKQERVDGYGGGYTDYITYSDGLQKINRHERCMHCQGSGKCSVCHGSLGTLNPRTGIYYPCNACLQTGDCNFCKGDGFNDSSTFLYFGSVVTITDSGEIIFPGGNKLPKPADGDVPAQKNCTRCHGTGVEGGPMYVDDPSGAAANAQGSMGYIHDRKDTRCPFCGKYRWHIHLSCSKCNGHA